jgi:hypothetical protein
LKSDFNIIVVFFQRGFIGCMRHITIDGNYKLPGDWKDEEYSSKDDIALESCLVVDRCTPNPCEHGGICKQTSEEFYCECENTGYALTFYAIFYLLYKLGSKAGNFLSGKKEGRGREGRDRDTKG